MMIEGQRQRSGGGKRRKKRARPEPKAKVEPVLIVARRPDSPLLMKVSNRNIAASARPKKAKDGAEPASAEAEDSPRDASAADRDRRVARIIKAPTTVPDDDQLRRERLLERLVMSEGRSAISRVADELLQDERVLPETQEVQLQLLEHVDERRAREAMEVMSRLLTAQAPIKRPILDQRLRRLESEADEQETREKAARLRRSLRVA